MIAVLLVGGLTGCGGGGGSKDAKSDSGEYGAGLGEDPTTTVAYIVFGVGLSFRL